MAGFRLKLNGLKNIAWADSLQRFLEDDLSFRTEYFFKGVWNPMVVRPMLVGSIVIFLVQFFGEDESMALVYNEKDAWSDIEKESTRLTEAVGSAIESHYSSDYCFGPWHPSDDALGGQPDSSLLN